MYCTRCGVQLDDTVCYCSHCGVVTHNAPVQAPLPARPLMRSRYNKKIAGVCGGVAQYLEVDVTVVRLIWLVLTFTPPSVGLIAYIVAWIVMPKEPERLTAGNGHVTAVYQS